MPKVELVICDMAGTTVFDADNVNEALRSALAEDGISVSRAEVNAVMGWTKPVAIEKLLARSGKYGLPVPQADVDRLYQVFLDTMLAYYRTSPDIRAIAGAEAALKQLKAAGVKVALDTGFSREIADAILERLGWRIGPGELLDASVTADEVPNGRPAPDMAQEAMRRTGVTDPQAVAKVGDTPSDIQEADNLGAGFRIGVLSGASTEAELAAHHPTHILKSVADLPALLLN